MKELPKDEQLVCEWMIGELEGLPSGDSADETVEVLLARLPEAAREHAAKCAQCESAVRDFVDTRLALAEMKESLPEAGPWFTTRVMQVIGAQEEEIEERQNGFWTGVRRFGATHCGFCDVATDVGRNMGVPGTASGADKWAGTAAGGGNFRNGADCAGERRYYCKHD